MNFLLWHGSKIPSQSGNLRYKGHFFSVESRKKWETNFTNQAQRILGRESKGFSLFDNANTCRSCDKEKKAISTWAKCSYFSKEEPWFLLCDVMNARSLDLTFRVADCSQLTYLHFLEGGLDLRSKPEQEKQKRTVVREKRQAEQ